MNPYETNTTPRQRREQRVIGAILARPWLLERAIAAGLTEEHMREPRHREVMRSLVFVAEGGAPFTPRAMIHAVVSATSGPPNEDALRVLMAIAESDLGPGRWEDARALRMPLEDLDALRERDAATPELEHGGPDARLLCSRCGAEWPILAESERHECPPERHRSNGDQERDFEPDNPPMLAPPDAVIEDGQVVCAKLDLDELERWAREAKKLPRLRGHQDPGITLALIARIRELEAELVSMVDSAVLPQNHARATLAKGVLP